MKKYIAPEFEEIRYNSEDVLLESKTDDYTQNASGLADGNGLFTLS